MELSQMSTTVSNNGLALCALGKSIECHVSRMLYHDHHWPNDS